MLIIILLFNVFMRIFIANFQKISKNAEKSKNFSLIFEISYCWVNLWNFWKKESNHTKIRFCWFIWWVLMNKQYFHLFITLIMIRKWLLFQKFLIVKRISKINDDILRTSLYMYYHYYDLYIWKNYKLHYRKKKTHK